MRSGQFRLRIKDFGLRILNPNSLILIPTFIIAILLYSFNGWSATMVSLSSGSWTSAATWTVTAGVDADGIPDADDNITIAATHIIIMSGNPGNCLSLTVDGTADWTGVRTTNVGIGGLIMNNGSVLNDASNSGRINVSGIFTVPAGASATIERMRFTVTGATTISGTVIYTNTGGTKTLGDITIASGGTWNSAAAENYTINGNVTNNGTFLANTGIYSLEGVSKTVGGSRNLIFDRVNISGSYTNTDSLQVSTNFAGLGTLTQSANSYFVIGDLSPVSILTASASGNTVRYLVAGNMNTLDITYHHLIIEELGGTANGNGIYTVNGDYSVVGGTASLTDVTIVGNITVNSGSTLNLGSGSPTILGTTTVNGTLTTTSITGTKTFNDLTVNAGGTWNSAVAEAFTINGNFSNSGTFTANNGIYTFAGVGKTISGTTSIPNTTVTGSYTNNGTFSSTSTLSGTGTFSQGTTGTLNMGVASFLVTTFNASASGNTVNYNRAGTQDVRVPSDASYHHLTISGSGTKTLLGVTDINGDITISSTLGANNFNMTVGGNWSSTGTFTPGTNTVTLDGAAQNISRTGGETFNHLTAAGSGTKTLGSAITTNGNLTISSTLDVTATNYGIDVNGNWTNSGTFVQNTGTVTFSGAAAQTIGGTTTTNFNNITQSNAAGVSLTQNQNLIDALTISAGTFTSTGFNFALKSTSSGTARIAAIPAGANFTGNIVMERYTGASPIDWRFLSSSVSGATIAQWADDFATSGFTGATCGPADCALPGCAATCNWPSIWWYDETLPGDLDTFGFIAATNVTNPITVGKGYWVYLGPNPVTFEVTGTPNKFAQAYSVTYTNSGNILNDGWNMISNSYPSAIDWDSPNWTKNASMDNAVYVYNSFTGSYASYVGGVGVNGGSNFIPSQQAFYVKTNAAGPVLSKIETVKASPNPTFLKTMNTRNTSNFPMAFKDFPIPQNTNNIPNSIKLTASGNGYDDETFIRFMQGATTNFDGQYDAYKLKGYYSDISSIINDTSDLSINSLPALTADIDIKIRFTVTVSGTYSIRRDSILMLPMSSCLILEDLLNGNMTDLRSVISYSFTISDTTKAPRFLLHISAPISKSSVNTNCAGDSTGIAIAQGTGTGPWNYLWTNSNGDTLQITPNISTPDSLFNLPAGIYSVEVSGSVCGTVTDTIEIKSSSALFFTVSYTDVTCNGLSDGTAFAYVIDGVSPFTYQWSNGATTAVVNNLSAGTYTVTVTETGGCSQTQTIVISQPSLLTAGFTTSTDTVDMSINNSASFTNTSSGGTSYYWDFGDGSPTDTAQNPVHYYSNIGTYTAMLIVSNGSCLDTAYKTIVVISSNPAAVTEITNPSLVNVAYENGEVFLLFNLPAAKDVSISIYNLLGEKVMMQNEQQVQKNKIRLRMENLSAGIYISIADMGDAVIARKIILPLR